MDTAVNFPTTPGAVKASPLELKRNMSAEQAFQAIARNCLAQIEANQDGVDKFHDVECLHQMRVGLRRLRSALSMYRAQLTLPATIANDLDWLLAQLGPARDWDVLAGATLPRVSSGSDEGEALVALTMAAHDKTHALHQVAAAAISSERYRNLMQNLSRWVNEREWREGMARKAKSQLKMTVRKFADGVLADDQQRLLRRGAKLRGASPEARHRVRIAAKKTRYAAEFFGSLYKGKRVKPYVKALTQLQDQLGWMNDVAVADTLLEELARGQVELRGAIETARALLAASADQEGTRTRKAWKRFAPLKAPA